MEPIQVELPDGRILEVPAGSSAEFIKSQVQRFMAGGAPTATIEPERSSLTMGQEMLASGTQSAFDAMGAESGRGRNMGDIFNATLRGEQSLDEGILQTVGQGAGYIGDIVGDVVGAGVEKLGEGLSYITPDPLEDEVINQLGIFMDQPMMRMAMRALEQGGEAWERFSTENPRAARNISAVTNITGVGVPTRIGGTTVSRMAREYEPSAARQARVDIESGGMPATNVRTAPYRLEETPRGAPTVVSEVGPLPEPVPTRRAIKSPVQQQAIKQGFDEGLVAMIREASPADRRNMLQSLDIMEQATGNKRFSMLNRTTDVAGQSVLKRYKAIREANTKAGRSIDRYARQNLKNQYVDFDQPVNNFLSKLQDMGIKQRDNLTLDFSNSDIKNLTGLENFISRIVDRMASPRDMTAYEVHTFKRFIDEQMTYGKSQEGLSGKIENAVKNLRRNLDNILDENFAGYNTANTRYAETINAMNEFQDLMGRKIDFDSQSAPTAVGTKLRGLGSNIQSRGRLLDSLGELQTLGNRYGQFDDDVINQAAFTMDLDRVFGTKADTSFAGQIGERIPTSRGEMVSAAARAAANKVRGINQEAQFKAMRELLNSFGDSIGN
jgi:hypothetical protein